VSTISLWLLDFRDRGTVAGLETGLLLMGGLLWFAETVFRFGGGRNSADGRGVWLAIRGRTGSVGLG
jgi:hypothetical protein